jgi:hypothetical protein
MIATRITPRIVILCLTLQSGVWLGSHLPVFFSGAHREQEMEFLFAAAASISGYALAFALNLEITAEYRDNTWMRWVWLFLAANAGLSIGREIVHLPLLNLIRHGYTESPLQGLHHQILILLANSFLVLGLLGMWWAYQRVGLGFRIQWRDYAEMAVILALTLALLLTHQGMSESASPYLASRLLQPSGLVLLSMAAAVSVVMRRMAVQMNGGKLAVALRCLTFYTMLRAILVLLEAIFSLSSQERRQTHDFIMSLDLLCWRTVPWILALAAAYRAELSVHANKELERQKTATAVPLSA